MALPELHVYPIITAILFPVTFFATYFIAVMVNIQLTKP